MYWFRGVESRRRMYPAAFLLLTASVLFSISSFYLDRKRFFGYTT